MRGRLRRARSADPSRRRGSAGAPPVSPSSPGAVIPALLARVPMAREPAQSSPWPVCPHGASDRCQGLPWAATLACEMERRALLGPCGSARTHAWRPPIGARRTCGGTCGAQTAPPGIVAREFSRPWGERGGKSW